jgi:PAS domain S-box-containing protein
MTSPKILIAEDDGLLSFYLEQKLRLMGYTEIFKVPSGEDAVIQAEEIQPDLILMDVQLSGQLDGIDAATRIKSSMNVPVIFITAMTDEETIKRAKRVAPHGYLIKPVEGKELELTVEIVFYKYELEAKLIESELKYRTLVMTATDGVLTLDEAGHITSCNKSALLITGFSKFDLIGSSLDVVMPEALPKVFTAPEADEKETPEGERGEPIETIARHGDGTLFPVELSFSRWKLKGQDGFTLIFRDITKRKETERELQSAHLALEEKIAQRNAEVSVLIERSPLPICVYDPGGQLIFINNPARQKFAFSRYRNSASFYNIFKDPFVDQSGYKEHLQSLFSRGGLFSTRPVFLDPADVELDEGEAVVLIFHFFAVTNDSGKIYSVLNVIEDITERAKAEESVRELAEEKNRSEVIFDSIDAERSRISTELHDGIGQLLSAVKFTIELAEKQKDNAAHLEKAKSLVAVAGKEIKNIVLSLHPTVLENHGLLAALNTLCDDIEHGSGLVTSRQFSGIETRFEPKLELAIYRIVQESLNNVVKHARAMEARIEVHKQDSVIDIVISDNGKGFSVELLNSGSNKHATGILKMRERVKLLNGSLSIESNAGKGTEITIDIPYEAKHE